MEIQLTDRPIGRTEAMALIAQMEEMKSRLISLHPDLQASSYGMATANQRAADTFGLLPGAANVEGDMGEVGSSNPQNTLREYSPANKPVRLQERDSLRNQRLQPLIPITSPRPLEAEGGVTLSDKEMCAIKELIRKELHARSTESTEDAEERAIGKGGFDVHDDPAEEMTATRKKVSEYIPSAARGEEPISSHREQLSFVRGESSAHVSRNIDGTMVGSVARRPSITSGANHRKRPSLEAAIDDHTGQIFAQATMASHVKDSDADSAADDDDWDTVAENAYGAFIHISLQDGVLSAWRRCGPMLLASVLIQGAFAYELFRALPDVEDAPHFCAIPSDLQLAALGVFVTLLLNNVTGMASAARLSLFSTEFRAAKSSADVAVATVRVHWLHRGLAFVCAVVTEMVTWTGILASGILFILTAESVDLVIRSTVAIIFVQNVDEIVFEAYCSAALKDYVRATKYKKPELPKALQGPWAKIDAIYSVWLHLPVVTAITAGIVFGMRARPGIACSSWYQGENTE